MKNVILLLIFIDFLVIAALLVALYGFAVRSTLMKYGRIRPRRHDDRVPLTRNQERSIWVLVSVLFVAWFFFFLSLGYGETVGESTWKALLVAVAVTLLTPNQSYFGIFILLIYNSRKRRRAERAVRVEKAEEKQVGKDQGA